MRWKCYVVAQAMDVEVTHPSGSRESNQLHIPLGGSPDDNDLAGGDHSFFIHDFRTRTTVEGTLHHPVRSDQAGDIPSVLSGQDGPPAHPPDQH